MIYIGIDPGKGGGVAVIDEQGVAGALVVTTKMPDTPADLLAWLMLRGGPRNVRAVLERVHAGVFGKGKRGRMGVSSAFTFGRGVGHIEMALLAAGIPYDEVAPATWQGALGCRSGGDKNVTKRRAQALFPHLKVTHATADCLLLAEYCRRLHSSEGP